MPFLIDKLRGAGDYSGLGRGSGRGIIFKLPMRKSVPSDSWAQMIWPDDIIPVPLDKHARPIEPRILLQDEKSSAKFYFVAPSTSIICADLINIIRPVLGSRPDVGIFYGDDAVMDSDGQVQSVHCKPACNEALLMADDYVGFPLLIRASVFEQVRPLFVWPHRTAGWYRFLLAAMNAGFSIDRIPKTLLASRITRPKAGRNGRLWALRQHFSDLGSPIDAKHGRVGDTLEVKRVFSSFPSVTLVIATRQSRAEVANGQASNPYIINLLDSLKRSTYPLEKIEVLIGDDNPDGEIYSGRQDKFKVRRINTARQPGEPFNYAAKMNRLWRAAETDAIVLMNDDLVVRSPGWLEALLTFSLDTGVGGVGARLLFPTGTIQHAGMFGGIFDVVAHPWYNVKDTLPTYEDWALTQRDCSVVTGAVFATRASVMHAVNGFDERFSLDFNDVDLCLKMRMLGYRIVYTPYAELVHHERASRQANLAPGDQVALFLRRWRSAISHDPAFSPQLRTDTDVVAPAGSATSWVTALRR